MNNWLVKLSSEMVTSEDQLRTAIESLPSEDLRELAIDTGVEEPTEKLAAFEERCQQADHMGRELAKTHGSTLYESVGGLTKEAFLGAAMGMLGKGLASGGVKQLATGIAKDVATNTATNAIAGGAKKAYNAVAAPASGAAGGFKYASQELVDEAFAEFAKEAGWSDALVKSLGSNAKGNGLLRGAAATMMKDPRKAMAIAGAGVGAMQGLMRDPGYDENGQRRSRIGAALKGGLGGGAIGYGVGHFSEGARNAVQGMGKDLSKDLQAHSWRNLKSPLGQSSSSQLAGAVANQKPSPASSMMAGSVQPRNANVQMSLPSPMGASAGQSLDAARTGMSAGKMLSPLEQARMMKSASSISTLSSVDRIKLAMRKKAGMGQLFTMSNPKTVARNLVHGGGAAGGLGQAAGRAVPPPTPARSGLMDVQRSLNSAQSIASAPRFGG